MTKKNKRILVTGGCGFIGSALVRHLLKSSQYKVLNVDKLTYAGNVNSIPGAKQSSNYEFAKVDICNRIKVEKLVANFKPNIIFHLAAESHVDRSISGPANFINTNIIGTFNVLEAARKFMLSNKKNNFIFHHISTDEVFGDLDFNDKLFTEETRYAPTSPYSSSKASSDHLVRAWHRTYDLPVVVTNCSNNYGPYHFPEKLIPLTILNAVHGKSINVYGSGKQIRDWLFVDDHVKALLKVAIKGTLGSTYNIGGNYEMTNIDVVEMICSKLDKKIKKKPNNIDSFRALIKHVDDRPGHDLRYAIDSSKMKNELGWVPKESFESGLEKTVNWFLNNSWWWEPIYKAKKK